MSKHRRYLELFLHSDLPLFWRMKNLIHDLVHILENYKIP